MKTILALFVFGVIWCRCSAMLVAAELRILPAVNPHVHDMTAGSTEPAIFSCAAPDLTTTEADLKWFNDQDEEITAASGGKYTSDFGTKLVLRISNPTDDDAGTYTCKGVVNGVSEEGSISLELYRGINMTSPLTQYATQGSVAKIWCRMTKTNLEKDISWYHENWALIRSDDKYRVGYENGAGQEGDYLEIKDIQLDDGGKYICNIDMMSVGKTLANFIQVVVTVPPKMIKSITFNPVVPKEGDRLVMSCEASGTPRPTFMFRKNNQDLLEQPNTDGNYIIEKVNRTDEGIYQCEATNKGGSDRSDVTLDVKIPPVIETPDDQTKKTVQEGREVRLQCRATGDPAPALTWQKKGSEIIYSVGTNDDVYVEEQEGNSEQDAQTRVYSKTLYLVIPTLKPKHAGEYVCTASTTAVTVEKTFKIDVMFKPNFDNQATTRFWGWVGSKTNLTCIANGNPEPVIEWHKDGQNLASIDDYLITNGNSGLPTRVISYLIPTVANGNVGSVFGSYSCKATNKFGDNTEELTFEQASEPDRVMVKSPRSGANAYEYTLSWDVPMTGGADIENYIVEYAEALEVNTNTEPWAAVRVLPQAQTENIPGQASTSVVLDNLKKNTFYQAKIKAVNSIGTSDETTFIFRTGSGVVPAVSGDDVTESDSLPAIAGGVGGGIVVIIIIVIIIIVFVVVSKRRRAAKKTTSIVSPHEEIHTYANQTAVLNNDRSDDNEDDDFGNYIDIIDDGVADTNQSAVGGESNYELPTRRSQVVDTNIYTGLAEQQQASTSQGNTNYELPTRRSQVVDTNIYTGLDQETETTQYQNTATQRPTAQEDTRCVFNQANKNESTDPTDYEIL